MKPTKFTIDIPLGTIQDLKSRLQNTRLPYQIKGSTWEYGMDTQYLKELLHYWTDEFDWYTQQARLNSFDNYLVEIDGIKIHFVHAQSSKNNPTPLLLMHGWPSSFVQMLDIIPFLTEAKHNALSFDVVAVSLPGFGFSDAAKERGLSVNKIAPFMHKLMTQALGYERYGIRSSDLGAGVANAMILQFPDSIIGSHTGGTNPWIQGLLPDDLTEEEQQFVQNVQSWMQNEMAYAQLHATKPQTLAVALNDSPAGLAAWIGEKFHTWTDNQGKIEDAVSLDSFFTNLTIYWATETINSSMRLYYETMRDMGGWGVSNVPVGYLMPAKDMFPTPKSWMERQGAIGHWTEVNQGGHFMEWEKPGIVAEDLRAFFGKLTA